MASSFFLDRNLTFSPSSGNFTCPTCGTRRRYTQKVVRRFLTVASLPVFPRETVGEYVECLTCHCTYNSRILSPETAGWLFEPEYFWAARRSMVLMMLADGVVQDEELDTIRRIYSELGGQEITRAKIIAEIEHAKVDRRDVFQFLRKMGGSLNAKGKEIVLRSACLVAAADGSFQDEEKKLIRTMGTAMEFPDAKIKRVLQWMSGLANTPEFGQMRLQGPEL